MQKAYSGWELEACSGSHGSFPAVPTWSAGEDLHDGVVTHGFCFSAGSGDSRSFPGELPGAAGGCGQRRGWTVSMPSHRPGGCRGAPARRHIPRVSSAPAPGARPYREQRLWERQVWGNGEGVCSPTLQVLKLVCGGRAVISVHRYLNINTRRIPSIF